MSEWFRIPQPRPSAGKRLFVIHHAGGSANAYSKWSMLAPSSHEVVLIELPGRGKRIKEPLLHNFDDLLQQLASEIHPLFDRPFSILGHSLGALIGFELARRELSESARSLLVSVGISSVLPPTQANLTARVPISHLGDDEFVKSLDLYSPLPDVVRNDTTALLFFLPIIRSDIEIMESYESSDVTNTGLPLVVFAGESDPIASPEKLAAWSDLGHLHKPVEVLPGDHFHVFANGPRILKSITDNRT